MRPVSINDFIRIIYSEDSNPPSQATIRRQCPQKDEHGRPLIPGAYKAGKPWKIDLDVYIPEMQRRLTGHTRDSDEGSDEERDIIDDLAFRLAS